MAEESQARGRRSAYRTRESEIVQVLAGATVRWPQVRIGSYPRFLPDGPEVEVLSGAGWLFRRRLT